MTQKTSGALHSICSIFVAILFGFGFGFGSAKATSQEVESNSTRDREIATDLRLFKTNPALAQKRIPEKRSASGARAKSKFSQTDVSSRDFVTKKSNWRKSKTKPSSRFSAPVYYDDPKTLLDRPAAMISKLGDMESLRAGSVAVQPWSGDYWGFFKGTLAARYADPRFPNSFDWKVNSDYVLQAGKTTTEVFATRNQELIDQLSPAEKYDLLVGNVFPLTEKMWEQGEFYYTRYGSVEDWMGICDGWTSAAYMLPRPRKSIVAIAADGVTKITFYPHDIKALASLLWAWGNWDVMGYVGARCDIKNPRTDANGRVLNEDCFNTNPGSWHQLIVNQIGANRQSIAMDATFDHEVWNQPIHSYFYSYFNPQTTLPTKSLEEARVSVANFGNDKFKTYRSKQAVSVVGIAMDLTYVAEDESPTASHEDSESRDHTYTVRYYYDLELDQNGQIVGGEWYQQAHPDFLWRPRTGAIAVSSYEPFAFGETWNMANPVPLTWRGSAYSASIYEGIPLERIVGEMIKKSSEPAP